MDRLGEHNHPGVDVVDPSPLRSGSRSVASIGPVSMSTGSTPTASMITTSDIVLILGRSGYDGVMVTPSRDDGDMTRQLVLIDATDVDWRLDDHTRELGRQGIAEAREALAAAAKRVAVAA